MTDHDPIDPLERALWERFTGPPAVPGAPGASGVPGVPGADPGGACPPAIELAAYLDGRLADAARDGMEAHLALCGECRAAAEDVRLAGACAAPFVAGSLLDSARALVPPRGAAPQRRWPVAARWSFAAAASLAMALLAFQAGTSFGGAARPSEDALLDGMSFGLLTPFDAWEPAIDPLPAGEDLP
jgi:hypothetical protein